jgi:DNA primase
MNLYNLNNSKDNIKLMGKAIVFESEKSCLLYQSYFGIESDISVACCGSNLSIHQVQLLLDAGAKEIIVAFDRQFEDIGDKEFKHLTKNLIKLNNKYKNEVLISFIFDKNKITSYKASPIDEGKEKFLKLFRERILL